MAKSFCEASMFSLRNLVDKDSVWIDRATQDPEIEQWTAHGGYSVNDHKVWVILDQDAEPVGIISIHSVDLLTSVADVGYWVAPWGRRKGAARTALKLVERELSKEPEVKSIQLKIMEGNDASVALATSLNYQLVSTGSCSCGTQGVVPAIIYEKKI